MISGQRPDSLSTQPILHLRFESGWRRFKELARIALDCGVEPQAIRFEGVIEGSEIAPCARQGSLFGGHSETGDANPERLVDVRGQGPAARRRVLLEGFGVVGRKRGRTAPVLQSTRSFEGLGRRAARHSDSTRYDLLYRILWRIQSEGRALLRAAADDDVRLLETLARQVRRDAHKAKAFVRFRKFESSAGALKARGVDDGHDWYVAWHRSDHDVLPLVADFFAERFSDQRWAILTPMRSVHWDLTGLTFSPGVSEGDARSGSTCDSSLEALWRSYYASTFNPARANLRATLQEMPSRYWRTMPETALIPDLLSAAGGETGRMVRQGLASMRPEAPVPANPTLVDLRETLRSCAACGLCENGTKVVPGEGSRGARLMILGEAPGSEEADAGRPFVGPAGRVLKQALVEAGVDRADCYLTNAVKHFKFSEPESRPGLSVGGLEARPTSSQTKRRIHETPSQVEVSACRPWWTTELAVVRPKALLCLGATAARVAIDPALRVHRDRGRWNTVRVWTEGGQIELPAVATIHPSHVLRTPDTGRRAQLFGHLVDDIRMAATRS